jgi:ppGpp synthetase/RelA/SpoT-type nucleotidyltranferase
MEALHIVRERLERPTHARELTAVTDYTAQPRPSGYRAMHLIVRYHGRLVEVQLRTPRAHQWAMGVETLSMEYGQDFKDGWVEPVSPWLEALSRAMWLMDVGEEIPPELFREIQAWRILADRHLEGVQRGRRH